MKTIEVSELKESADKLLRLIKEGETIDLIEDGIIIAHVIPTHGSEEQISKDSAAWEKLNQIALELAPYWTKGTDPQERERDMEQYWSRTERLAEEIGSYVPEKIDVNDIMRDIRRDL